METPLKIFCISDDCKGTPRAAMTLSRREQLELWRASKRHKGGETSNESKENTNPRPQILSCDRALRKPSDGVRLAVDYGGLPENSISEPAIESSEEASKNEKVPTEATLELRDAECIVLHESIAEEFPVDELDSAQVDCNTQIEQSTPSDQRNPDLSLEAMSTVEVRLSSTCVIDETEYDVSLLLLANDTLVQQLACSEARRIAEGSRLRQEREEIKLELDMQESRFKIHLKRLEEATHQSLMASLERIHQLTEDLQSAHETINCLQRKLRSRKD
jgi:hypothetical protein